MSAEPKMLGWRKGERSGSVVLGGRRHDGRVPGGPRWSSPSAPGTTVECR